MYKGFKMYTLDATDTCVNTVRDKDI